MPLECSSAWEPEGWGEEGAITQRQSVSRVCAPEPDTCVQILALALLSDCVTLC